MWLWRLAFAALQALLVFSYHRLRLLQSECRENTLQSCTTAAGGHMQSEASAALSSVRMQVSWGSLTLRPPPAM